MACRYCKASSIATQYGDSRLELFKARRRRLVHDMGILKNDESCMHQCLQRHTAALHRPATKRTSLAYYIGINAQLVGG